MACSTRLRNLTASSAGFPFGLGAGVDRWRLGQGAFDGGTQPRQTILENEIVGAGLDERSGRLVAQRARDGDDRQIGALLPHQLDRRKTVEFRQLVVAEHDIGLEALESLDEALAGVGTPAVNAKPAWRSARSIRSASLGTSSRIRMRSFCLASIGILAALMLPSFIFSPASQRPRAFRAATRPRSWQAIC